MSSDQLLKYLKKQIEEMEKYKWELGVQIGHDPLQDRSIEEIYCEWIKNNAKKFKESYMKGECCGY